MIKMRKHIPAVVLSLFMCLLFSQAALASGTDWQIKWQENGSLQEKVNVTGQELHNVDAGWQMSSTGNKVILNRDINNWEAYNSLTDKLPLQAKVKNYLCCNIITLTALPEVQKNTLYSSLDPNQTIRLEMNVPGIILDSSAVGRDNKTVYWVIKNPGEKLGQKFIFRAIMIDGFGLGITILILGVIFLTIFFIARMRKVNRIIDETYSLDNIIIEDEEDDEANSDTSDGAKSEENLNK